MWAARAVARCQKISSKHVCISVARCLGTWKGDARARKTNLSGMQEEDSYTAADEAHSFEARARRDRKASSESTSEFEELPVGYSCKVYHSPDSMLIRGLGALMALNGVGAAAGTLLALQDELTKLYAILEAAEMNNTAPSDFLLSTTMPLPVSSPAHATPQKNLHCTPLHRTLSCPPSCWPSVAACSKWPVWP